MTQSPNLGLTLTPASDTTKRFIDWRTELTSDDSRSNMMLIDTEFVKSAQGYGTCTTVATTLTKIGILSEFVLDIGSTIGITFTYANTATSPTLNVNSTGAKPIYYNGAYITTGMITAGMTALFQYNGTQWVLLNPASYETDFTLAVASWSSGYQTVSITGLGATQSGYYNVKPGSTDAQYTAYEKAKIVTSSQAAGTITFWARGTTPTIAIPMTALLIN